MDCIFQKNIFALWFYALSPPPPHVYSLVNKKASSLWSFVASLKKKSLQLLILYTSFHDLMYIAVGQGQTIPRKQNFLCQQKPATLVINFVSLKKKKKLIRIFFMILYMYLAQGQGQTTPSEQNFDVNRKAWSLCPFVASFKKISEISELYIFIHVYSPRAGNPMGTKFWHQQTSGHFICCKFLPLNDFLPFFLKKYIFSHIKA